LFNLSIVIPCYNRGKNVCKVLHSILPLLVSHKIEIILSDDSDNPKSLEYLLSFSKGFPKNIIYSKNESRLGYASNLIRGISLSSGRHLFFLLDEDSIIIDRFLDFIKEIHLNDYEMVIGGSNINTGKNKLKIFNKVPNIEIVGELRHLSGLVLKRDVACKAVINTSVIDAINKVPQYPQVSIGLYCASKFTVYKYNAPVCEVGYDGNSGSNWSRNGSLERFSTLSSRAVQAESWLNMTGSLTDGDEFPMAYSINKSLEEWIYILIEQGVISSYSKDTSFVFYKRSIINATRWMIKNNMIIRFFKYILVERLQSK